MVDGRWHASGDHTVSVAFQGQLPLLPVRVEQKLKVARGVLEVTTVPAVPGAQFALDGRQFSAGQDGVARIEVDGTGPFELSAAPSSILRPGVRSDFARWSNELFVPTQTIRMPLNCSNRGRLQHLLRDDAELHVDGDTAVDPQRVSSLRWRAALDAGRR